MGNGFLIKKTNKNGTDFVQIEKNKNWDNLIKIVNSEKFLNDLKNIL